MFSARQNFFGGSGSAPLPGRFTIIQETSGNFSYCYAPALYSTGEMVGCWIFQSISGAPRYNVLAKFDATGVLLWQKKIAISDDWVINQSLIDNSGNIYISGYSQSGSITTYCFVLKFSSDGTLLWQKKIATTNGLGQSTIALNNSQTAIYHVGSYGGVYQTLILTSLDTSTGSLIATNKLSFAQQTSIQNIQFDNSGFIYLFGTIFNVPSGYASGIVIKLNTSLVLQWRRILTNIAQYIQGRAGTLDPSGIPFILLKLNDGNLGIVKLNSSDGSIAWSYKVTNTSVGTGSISSNQTGKLYLSSFNDSNQQITMGINTGSTPTISFQNSFVSTPNSSVFNPWTMGLDSAGILNPGGHSNSGGTGNYGLMTLLLIDGTGTGTYTTSFGTFTYATSTVSALTTTSLSLASTTLTTSAGATITDATSTISAGSATFTTAALI